MSLSTVLAIFGMAAATFACRYGGYWLFSHIRPSASLKIALGYIPGALFVSYVAPALLAGGPMQWVGGVATMVLMLAVRDLSLSVLGRYGGRMGLVGLGLTRGARNLKRKLCRFALAGTRRHRTMLLPWR